LQDAKVRLHSLDALRGLAALDVVLWHWQHFQLLGTQKSTWSWSVGARPLDHSHQPFFVSWHGNISYSSYLLHFPLQMIFALAIVGGFVPLWARDSDSLFLTHVAILIAISLLSFRSFEAPIQQMLRQTWGNVVQVPHLRRGQHIEPVR
jgi:peptidoglycan/LPS O-acetylase OafA/YrhL